MTAIDRRLFPVHLAAEVRAQAEQLALAFGLAGSRVQGQPLVAAWQGVIQAAAVELRLSMDWALDYVLLETGAATDEALAALRPGLDAIAGRLTPADLTLAAQDWRSDPGALVRAAIGAPSHELASTVLEAIVESDDEATWREAVMAAMLLPLDDSLWIIDFALARETDPQRSES